MRDLPSASPSAIDRHTVCVRLLSPNNKAVLVRRVATCLGGLAALSCLLEIWRSIPSSSGDHAWAWAAATALPYAPRPSPAACRGRARAVLGCAVLPQESATTTRGFRTCGRARSVCWAMYINKGKIRGSGGRMPGSRAVYGPSNLHDSRMLSATRTSQVSGWCGRRWPPPLLVSAASIDIYATCRPGSARGCRRRGPPSAATWHTRPPASSSK